MTGGYLRDDRRVADDASTPAPVQPRVAGRVVVIDDDGCVLLFCGHDPHRPERGRFWFTPGGGVDNGETIEQAAARELYEETGLSMTHLGTVRFERATVFDFESVRYEQREHFFCVQVPRFEPIDTRWSDIERRSVLDHRWWRRDDLATTSETVYPEALVEMLDHVFGPPVR
jgi:8-oxo-dGTP pyrophosphatase MutT (NUDIX family)